MSVFDSWLVLASGEVVSRGLPAVPQTRGNRVISMPRRVVAGSLAIGLLAVVSACGRSSTSTSPTTTGPSSHATATDGLATGQFGSMSEPVCGPAASSSTSSGTAAPAGASTGVNVQGVTPTSIRVGTISDVGYSGYPGLNQELFDASDVFVKWCNSAGGINGHLIQLDKLDAKLLEYQSTIATACSQEFALVGGGGVLDSTGQADRLTCLLPDFSGYVVSPEARGSDLSVQATNGGSNTEVSFGLGRYLQDKFPDAGAKVGYLTGAVPATIINKKQYQEAGATLGWKTLYDDRYDAVGESNWLPFAQAAEPLNPPKGPRSASSLSWPSRAASASSTGTPTAAPTTATRRTSCR